MSTYKKKSSTWVEQWRLILTAEEFHNHFQRFPIRQCKSNNDSFSLLTSSPCYSGDSWHEHFSNIFGSQHRCDTGAIPHSCSCFCFILLSSSVVFYWTAHLFKNITKEVSEQPKVRNLPYSVILLCRFNCNAQYWWQTFDHHSPHTIRNNPSPVCLHFAPGNWGHVLLSWLWLSS